MKMVKSIMTTHMDDFEITVLFGHASPGDKHADFFDGRHGLTNFVSGMLT